jgi:hypothetical protein
MAKIHFEYEFGCPHCQGKVNFVKIMEMPLVGQSAKCKCAHCEKEIIIEFSADNYDGELVVKAAAS